jgi:hypothetical protein
MLDLFHYTDKERWNAIRSQPIWRFKASKPNGIAGERYSSFPEIPFGDLTELFVYRDSAAADLWDADGAVPIASNTMIHLIADGNSIAVVNDEKVAAMESVIDAIRSALSDEILGPELISEAA